MRLAKDQGFIRKEGFDPMYCLEKITAITRNGSYHGGQSSPVLPVYSGCPAPVRPGKISSRRTRHITEAKQYKRSGARCCRTNTSKQN